jgi:hypothetical protein
MSPHAYDQTYTDYDRYIAELAKEQESYVEPPLDPEEHDAEVIKLWVKCLLCGFSCSPETWDGESRPCINCGATRKPVA